MNIDTALHILYQRQITSRDQLLKEMLRVKLTQKKMGGKSLLPSEKEKLFQMMKDATEEELGFFPADRSDFLSIFEALKDIDLIAFALEIYRDDRTGTIVSPSCLSQYISRRMGEKKPQTALITEAEKHLAGLGELISDHPGTAITLTTQHHSMYHLLQLAFGEQEHVRIRFTSIYRECLIDEMYDYIHSLPTFGQRPEEFGKEFLTRDSEGVALENMLAHLTDRGTLDIIVPAKFTFAGMGYQTLRSYINNHFQVESLYILPEGTFRPSTAIKTYLISITTEKRPTVAIGTFSMDRKAMVVRDKRTLAIGDFLSHEDWRIELLLSEEDDTIRRFQTSGLPKVRLKHVAEVFRGKSILKKDTAMGQIGVLNISNIENGEIDYRHLDTIDEEERKVKRYELISGDVVLSCRGTAIKSAVFETQDQTIIASANLIVIRPKAQLRGEIIKIFLESPVGLAIIQSFQRGTTVMNINFTDIMEMEIPLLPMEKQDELIRRYHEERAIYQEAVQSAENRWAQVKKTIYNALT